MVFLILSHFLNIIVILKKVEQFKTTGFGAESIVSYQQLGITRITLLVIIWLASS